jgi:lipoprotein-releasing system permease protein
VNISTFIARRYLFSKKSSNAVNIISWISVFSIAMATFALVVVLSAFNGLQDIVESMYEEFEADVKISLKKGKWMEEGLIDQAALMEINGVEQVQNSLEELTLVRYGKQQSPCTVKGVNQAFLRSSGLENKLFEGSARLEINHQPTALVGYGLASVLSLYVDNAMESLKFYAPKLTGTTILNPEEAFYTKSISPAGIFMINPDIDNKYIIVPMEFAQKLLRKEGKITAIELKVKDGMEEEVRDEIIALIGDSFNVKTRFELNEVVYQTNQSEKVVTFFILAFILVIAAFNVISTLTMILLEKEKDILTMRYLGFDLSRIRRIFVTEGMFINGLGIIAGMLIGLVLCILQIRYGLVRLEGGIVEFYPVKLMLKDFIIILGTALIIAYVASYFPSRILIKGQIYDNNTAEE